MSRGRSASPSYDTRLTLASLLLVISDLTRLLQAEQSIRSPMLSFDLSDIPVGSVVHRAILTLYAINSGENYQSAYIYPIRRPWEGASVTFDSPWDSPGALSADSD